MDLSVKSYSYNNRPSFTAHWAPGFISHINDKGYAEANSLVSKATRPLTEAEIEKPIIDANAVIEKITAFLEKMHEDIEFSRMLVDGDKRPWGLNFNIGRDTIRIKPASFLQREEISYCDDSVFINGLPSPQGYTASYADENMSLSSWGIIADKIAKINPKNIEHTFLLRMIKKAKAKAGSEVMTPEELEKTAQRISKFAQDINCPEAAQIGPILKGIQYKYLQTIETQKHNQDLLRQVKKKYQ